MRRDAGLFLVLFSLFALWVYNTGRANAVLAALKGSPIGPAPGTGTHPTVSPTGSQGGGGAVLTCLAATGGIEDPGCYIQAIANPAALVSGVKTTFNDLFGWTGIKL